MSTKTEFARGCSEEFQELCALSTSGELSAEEVARLDAHIAACPACAALLDEYRSLARVGMAKLAAARDEDEDVLTLLDDRKGREDEAKQPRTHRGGRRVRWLVVAVGTAAAFLIAVAGAFEIGRGTAISKSPTPTATVASPATTPDTENHHLKGELNAVQASLQQVALKATAAEKQVADLSDARASLLAEIAALTRKDNNDAASLASVTHQRDGLEQQLADTSSSLTRAREELTRTQQERQGVLYRVATLETEVNDLNTQLAHSSTSAPGDEKFLAADRDIRELMGARELYIADVFDVENNGERSKPFGRVFYTKGKSLIFYAFDLQKQPGYHEAKAFQAWGKPDSGSAKPISLGIFYEDSEQNRRWIVKSDNPDVLAEINTVFVTVEPKGGSAKPSGKPFLEAYLHSLPPNHP